MSDLADLYQYWGNDLVLGSTGDIAPAFRSDRTSQRIMRRLLTNPGGGDYPWQPDYGAGLPAKIGQNLDLGHLRTLIVGQIALEPTVARNPMPQVTLTPFRGGVSISVLYYDQTGSGIPLSFNLAATPQPGTGQSSLGLEAPTPPSPHQLPLPETAHR
ncbi:MAG: hypothetical protein WCC64_06790 [Aliidongia sp.]